MFELMAGLSFMTCDFTSASDGSCAALAGTCAVASTCSSSDSSYPEPAACAAVGAADSGIAMSQANCEAAVPPGGTCTNSDDCTCVFAADSACAADATALAATLADRTGATMALHLCVIQGVAGEVACTALKTECAPSAASPSDADTQACGGYSINTQADCEAAGACTWATEPSDCEWSSGACVATTANLATMATAMAALDMMSGATQCTPGAADCSCSAGDITAMIAMDQENPDMSAMSSGCMSCLMSAGGEDGASAAACMGGGCTPGAADCSCTAGDMATIM